MAPDPDLESAATQPPTSRSQLASGLPPNDAGIYLETQPPRRARAADDLEPAAVFNKNGFTATFNDLARNRITETMSNLDAHLNIILGFSALFSAAISGVLTLSWPLLSNSGDKTNYLLELLVHSNNATILPSPPIPPSERPSWHAILVNCLLTGSLTSALLASFGAVLGKQWLIYFGRVSSTNATSTQLELQRWLDGAHRWHLRAIIEGLLPSLLQVSLAMFILGLLEFCRIASTQIYAVNLAFAAAGLAGLILALRDPYCPFQTPTSRNKFAIAGFDFLRSLLHGILRRFPIPRLSFHLPQLTSTNLLVLRKTFYNKIGKLRSEWSEPSHADLCASSAAWTLANIRDPIVLEQAARSILEIRNSQFLNGLIENGAFESLEGRWRVAVLKAETDPSVTMGDASSNTSVEVLLYEGAILHISVTQSYKAEYPILEPGWQILDRKPNRQDQDNLTLSKISTDVRGNLRDTYLAAMLKRAGRISNRLLYGLKDAVLASCTEDEAITPTSVTLLARALVFVIKGVNAHYGDDLQQTDHLEKDFLDGLRLDYISPSDEALLWRIISALNVYNESISMPNLDYQLRQVCHMIVTWMTRYTNSSIPITVLSKLRSPLLQAVYKILSYDDLMLFFSLQDSLNLRSLTLAEKAKHFCVDHNILQWSAVMLAEAAMTRQIQSLPLHGISQEDLLCLSLCIDRRAELVSQGLQDVPVEIPVYRAVARILESDMLSDGQNGDGFKAFHLSLERLEKLNPHEPQVCDVTHPSQGLDPTPNTTHSAHKHFTGEEESIGSTTKACDAAPHYGLVAKATPVARNLEEIIAARVELAYKEWTRE